MVFKEIFCLSLQYRHFTLLLVVTLSMYKQSITEMNGIIGTLLY